MKRNTIYECLCKLYDLSVEAQTELLSVDSRIDPVALAKEWQTIKVCGPRRAGHTTDAARFCIERNGLYVAPSLGNLEQVQKEWPELPATLLKRITNGGERGRPFPYSLIAFDAASFISKSALDAMYREITGLNRGQCPFVFAFVE
jgi:hypothetical protein